MDGKVNIFQTAGRAPIQDSRDVTDWFNFVLGLFASIGVAKSVEELQDLFESTREKKTVITKATVNVERYNIQEPINATN
jgi:hypothetical protein